MKFDPMVWASQNDANTVVNEQNAKAAQVSNPTTADCGDELAKAQTTADELLRMGANIAESYDEYLHLGMALANGLGEQGRRRVEEEAGGGLQGHFVPHRAGELL